MRRTVGGALVLGLLLAGPAAADEQARAILTRALQAHGGEENLGKFKALTWKGKGKFHAFGDGIDFTGTWYVELPRRARVELVLEVMGMPIKIARALDGEKGWVKTNDNVEDLDEETLAEENQGRHNGWVASLLPLKDAAFTLTALGESQVQGKPVVGVKVAYKGRRDLNLYFDKEKGLLTKSEVRVRNMDGQEVTQVTIYSDYKDVDGVKRAHRQSITRDGKPFAEVQLSDFRGLPRLDDALFVKP